MKRVVHWFRRDLRVADNTALAEAARQGEAVYPLFILDRDILAAADMGAARIAFLLDSLRDLGANLEQLGYRLTVRHGNALDELERFCGETQAEAVFCNRDYEPHCLQRDQSAFRRLNELGIGFQTFKDSVVWEEQEILTRAGAPYTVFTPYAKAWRAKPWPPPRSKIAPAKAPPQAPGECLPIPASSAELGFPLNQSIARGGETQARRLLETFLQRRLLAYAARRDLPAAAGTSGLSAHFHFGTIDVRTVLAGVDRATRGLDDAGGAGARTFVNELIWREFYLQIMTHFPHVLTGCFRPEYDAIAWDHDERLFEAWCAGQTGFPIVDAAMRCLNATGWMHNRLRMVVSMFLAKDLLLPWQWGGAVFHAHARRRGPRRQ